MTNKIFTKKILSYVAVAFIVAAAFVFFNSVKRNPLLAEDGTEFALAKVVKIISDENLRDGTSAGSQSLLLEIKSGCHNGKVVEGSNMNGFLYGADCKEGMKVSVRISDYDGKLFASVFNYDRETQIFVFIAFFLLLMWIVGGKKGINSVIALAFTFFMIIWLYLPLLYIGLSAFVAAIFVCSLVTFVSLYFIGGATKKTFCAIFGTVFGVVVAGIIALLFGKVSNVSGMNVDTIETMMYIKANSKLDVAGLLFSGILISSLGAVMDVAMSLSSALNEIATRNPSLTRKELFKSGMNIGRDMIGTMSNTLILAYVGTSINTLLIIYAYNYSSCQVLNMYPIAIELMQSLSGTMGIILTVPFVSAFSSVVFKKSEKK